MTVSSDRYPGADVRSGRTSSCERRGLDADVGPRHGAAVVPVEVVVGRPRRRGSGQRPERRAYQELAAE